MSSFFQTSDFKPVKQSKVSIPATNGLDYNPNQRIEIYIPPDNEFINPKETFLECDLKIKMPENASSVLTVNPSNFVALPHLLIKDIRVYSGGSGRILLDEIQNVNVLTNLKYDYDTNENLVNKRSITEGFNKYNIEHRGTRGGTKADINDFTHSPYFKAPTGTLNASMNNSNYLDAKLLLPIPSGLFNSDRVLMVGMLQGLNIELTLESNENIIKQLDTVNFNRMVHSLPVFHSTNGSSVPDSPASGSAVPHVYLRPNNCIGNDPLQVPFRVGETVSFINSSTLSTTVLGKSVPDAGTWEISSIVSDASVSGSLVKVSFATSRNVSGQTLTAGQSVMYSTSVEKETNYNVTYQVKNVNLICERLEMSSQFKSNVLSMMREGGTFNYDFPTYTNYRISQLPSDRVANLRLPLQNSRVKGICCVPTDSTVRSQVSKIISNNSYIQYLQTSNSNAPTRDNKQGYNGIADNITQYQILYDNQLNPAFPVKCNKVSSKKSLNGQFFHELENGLVASGINVRSLERFRENFIIARQMAAGNGVIDTRGKDFNLQVDYNETDPPEFAKLWNNYVHHIRRIVFSNNGISLSI